MVDSYRKINYSLRPAKAIERKMLIEAVRRLSVFGSLYSYRYIGFGSIYFSDFSLFHKSLGLKNMLSIERDKPDNESHKKRFEFNKPYGFINIEFGDSWKVLPTIPWDGIKTVLWLDYDGTLDTFCLKDISTFFSKAVSGSFIAISFNIQDQCTEEKTTPLQRLENAVGDNKVPRNINPDKDLLGWERAEVFRSIINNDLDFYKPNAEFYKIDVPCLTFREIRKLDSLIPIDKKDYPTIHIPVGDIDKYQNIYRYFPTFTEADL